MYGLSSIHRKHTSYVRAHRTAPAAFRRGNTMKLNPESVARASSRHPWRTIGAWFLAIVAMGAVTGSLLAGVLTQDIAFTNKPESVKAQDVIDAHFSNGPDTSDTESLIGQSDAP